MAVGTRDLRVDVEHGLHRVCTSRQLTERRKGIAERVGGDDGVFARLPVADVSAEERRGGAIAAGDESRFAIGNARKDHEDATGARALQPDCVLDVDALRVCGGRDEQCVCDCE